MKKYSSLFVFIILSYAALSQDQQPIDYVNPFINTRTSRYFFFSSACRPYGMVSLSPDTWPHGSWHSGYLYDSIHPVF